MKELLHPIEKILDPAHVPDLAGLANTCIYRFSFERCDDTVKWTISTRGDAAHIKILEDEKFSQEDRKIILDFETKFQDAKVYDCTDEQKANRDKPINKE